MDRNTGYFGISLAWLAICVGMFLFVLLALWSRGTGVGLHLSSADDLAGGDAALDFGADVGLGGGEFVEVAAQETLTNHSWITIRVHPLIAQIERASTSPGLAPGARAEQSMKPADVS
jgi:hypothetical protein